MSGKPETLYDLMKSVAEAIELSPGNYYQSDWEKPARRILWSEGIEACGTAYCRAGWMVNLLEKPTPTGEHDNVAQKASNLLEAAGVHPREIQNLFSGGACFYSGRPGSDTYVKDGINGVKRFMAQHEDKLKAFKLDGVLDDDGRISVDKLRKAS